MLELRLSKKKQVEATHKVLSILGLSARFSSRGLRYSIDAYMNCVDACYQTLKHKMNGRRIGIPGATGTFDTRAIDVAGRDACLIRHGLD